MWALLFRLIRVTASSGEKSTIRESGILHMCHPRTPAKCTSMIAQEQKETERVQRLQCNFLKI